MARETFASVMAVLWTSLGLALPPASGPLTLRIDGRTVRLSPSPDATQVVIEAAVGALATVQHRREAQLRQMLREGLGLVLDNRAALTLAADGTVSAVAAGPCRADEVALLRALIEDNFGVRITEIMNPRERLVGLAA